MKLFTFGDSWTEGVGGNLKEEYATNIPEERTKIRHKYAWPTKLSKLLNVDLQNDGVGGFSNNAIFNAISFKLKNDLITSNDFVIIMWSSSLRDSVPFFPIDNNFQFWGKRHTTKEHLYKYLLSDMIVDNAKFKRIDKDYKNYFINNLYTDVYYDIINQNYILYLQFILKKLGIRYLFCDGFDLMIRNDIHSTIDKTHLIDELHYWKFKNKTFKDYLSDTHRKDVWEDGFHWLPNTDGKHPNKNGYEIIADELYNFIVKNNLLNPIQIDNSFLI
jgi:lysophospholipase L1-like esterase